MDEFGTIVDDFEMTPAIRECHRIFKRYCALVEERNALLKANNLLKRYNCEIKGFEEAYSKLHKELVELDSGTPV